MTSIWLWRRGPLVIRLWPWRWIDIKLRVSAGLFILNHNNFPSFLGREDNPPGNKPEHWCKLSIIRLFFCFYFIRTGAFDEQEAKVWILEDDSLKQEFHKQAHETLLLSSSEEEWNWPHFHWPVSDSCQVRRMTDGTNWISRDIIEVRSTTLGKEMRRSTRLYTYEESLTALAKKPSRGRQRELYCRAFGLLDPTASLFETTACAWLRISFFLKSFLLKWGKPYFESFFTAFLSKWEIHSQGNRRLKMDSSTEDAFQGKSHDNAFSRFLICLIDE